MEPKKILIVSRSFYPENSPRSFRTTELIKQFARMGHELTLLIPKEDEYHIPFGKEYGVTIKNLGPLRFPKIVLNGKNGFSGIMKRALRRGASLLIEYPNIELMFRVNNALKKESGYDLLISVAVPHPIHWGVALARSEKHPIAKTWVADCGDPYMGAHLDTFNKMFYFKYFEKAFCRKADFISVPLEEAKEGYYPEFREKIVVIPQGFNFDEGVINQSGYKKNEVPTFAYAGNFIPGGRDPRPFLDYLVTRDLEYKFIIYTKSRGLVEPYLARADGKIEVRDYIPRHELLNVLSKMDFLVNFENSTSLQLPSKLIDYYLTDCPVLSVNNSNIDKGVIHEFLNGIYTKAYNFQNMEQFKIENVCQQFLNLSEREYEPSRG